MNLPAGIASLAAFHAAVAQVVDGYGRQIAACVPDFQQMAQKIVELEALARKKNLELAELLSASEAVFDGDACRADACPEVGCEWTRFREAVRGARRSA